MNMLIKRIIPFLFIAGFGALQGVHAQEAQNTESKPVAETSAPESAHESVDDADVSKQGWGPREWRRIGHGARGSKEVAIGHDAMLAPGKRAESVVAVFGSVDSAGEVKDQVVAVLGNARVTGPVDGEVAVIGGNLFIDSRIGGDVSVVLGNVTLGPQADIKGDVSVVGGTLNRDAASRIGGSTELVAKGKSVSVGWLRPWIEECLLYARPLAVEPGLGWAWGLALGFLAFYILLAFAFRDAFDRCVQTLETRPGRSVLASLLTMILTPVTFVLVFCTIIGILLLPFLGLALFLVGLFGKAVVLAVLGRRFTGHMGRGVFAHHAFAVLLGGILVLALYLVPVVGFIVYKLLGILGLGVVMYTMVLTARANSAANRERNASAAAAAQSAAASAAAEPAKPSEPSGNAGVSPAVAATLPRAGFWVRMGALGIDVILVGAVIAVLPFVGGISLLLLAAYGAVMWKLKSTTIGGIVFGLQVVRTDGRPVDWATAVVRALGCFLSLFIAGLGFLWIAFDSQKQGWHDKIAGTVVVRVPKGISLL